MIDGLVSIIMPSFNTASFVKKSIESVLSQTYTNWELIIVDDCSNDSSIDVITSFNDERIVTIENDTNRGAAVSRNIAIRNAKGEWIAFLDSDDIWDSKKLEKMIAFMKTNNYSFAYHNYEKIDEDGNKLGVFVTGPKVVTRRKMYHYDYIGCLTFMYSSKVHGLIQINDIKKNNDYAILLKLCKKANCYLLPENLAQYRIRKKSISHDKIIYKIKSHYQLFHECDNRCSFVSLILALGNMWYGFFKKLKYEKHIG